MTPVSVTALGAGLALLVSALVMLEERKGATRLLVWAPLAVMLPLALALTFMPAARASWPPLTAIAVVAVLARPRHDALHTECALKLLWVMAPAYALSWAGLQLLVIATGTDAPIEWWGVLALGLHEPFLWSGGLALALLAGVVMLGGAPFHFWLADVFQGARSWVAPLSVATLQAGGFLWVARVTVGVEAFEDARRFAGGVLGIAAGTALLAGAVTLIWQRRPERRVGTLASLQGGLALAWLSSHLGEAPEAHARFLALWAAHAALALSGAGVLARHLALPAEEPGRAVVLFRRHPLFGIAGLYAFASLAGLPGTPGALVWLEVGRAVATSGSGWIALWLALAWIAATSVTIHLAREAFGVPTDVPAPPAPVPAVVRAALAVSAAGLVFVGVGLLRGMLG